MQSNIYVKIQDKKWLSDKLKCCRCEKPISANTAFFEGKVDFICEDCLDDNDYFTLNTGYFSNEFESFSFLFYRWNIDEMYKYAKQNMKPVNIATKLLEGWNFSGLVYVNEALIENVDVTKPCIIANLSQNRHEYLLVDGNHRLRKAIKEGLEHISCCIFDFKEQFKFLVGSDFDLLEKMVKNSKK